MNWLPHSPSFEEISNTLQIFWHGIADEKRKNIWMQVTFLIGMAWHSQNLIQQIQSVVMSEGVQNSDFDAFIDNYMQSDLGTQLQIQSEVTQYLISRNQ